MKTTLTKIAGKLRYSVELTACLIQTFDIKLGRRIYLRTGIMLPAYKWERSCNGRYLQNRLNHQHKTEFKYGVYHD